MSMNLFPIRNDDDHGRALARVDQLIDAPEGTTEADELEVWAVLIDAYEEKHHAIGLPDPIGAIVASLEQKGLERSDLETILGCHRGRVSEVLNDKRGLSLEMMRRLHEALDLPYEVLMQAAGTGASPSSKVGDTEKMRAVRG